MEEKLKNTVLKGAEVQTVLLKCAEKVAKIESKVQNCTVQHSSHQLQVPIEYLKCSQSELKYAVSLKYMPDFKDRIKKECKIPQ